MALCCLIGKETTPFEHVPRVWRSACEVKGEVGRCVSLLGLPQAILMLLLVALKPRAEHLACSVRPFIASTKVRLRQSTMRRATASKGVRRVAARFLEGLSRLRCVRLIQPLSSGRLKTAC